MILTIHCAQNSMSEGDKQWVFLWDNDTDPMFIDFAVASVKPVSN